MSTIAASRERRTRALVVAGSAVGHLLVLVLIGINAPGVRRVMIEREEAPPPPFVVELYEPPPPPPPPPEVRKAAVAAPLPSLTQPRPVPAPLPSPARPRPVAPQAPPAPIAPLPMEPVPRPPAAAAPAPVTGAGSGGALTPFSQPGGDLRNALRRSSPGCANDEAVGLNRREQEGCRERLGKGAKDADFIATPMARAKREGYDASAARKQSDREWREGGMPSGVTGDGLGGEGRDATWRPK